jgi:hypothetical protein
MPLPPVFIQAKSLKMLGAILFFLLLPISQVYSQNDTPIIINSDINRFWEAFDMLSYANNLPDSIRIIQQGYLDKASIGLKKFIKVRNITANSLLYQIKKAPAYWKGIRPNTYLIQEYKADIASQMDLYDQSLRNFRPPFICFAIGQLTSGGTVRDNWLLIGTEMVTSDSTIDKSQLTEWHRSVLPKEPKILEFTAHEMVHTQQRFGLVYLWAMERNRLLTMSIKEGAADFVSEKITGLNINESIHPYGLANEEELWKEFSEEMYGKDFSKWLYNGEKSSNRPADLGYFIGYRICEAYYEQSKNKEKALHKIIKTNSYRRLLKKSGYAERFD